MGDRVENAGGDNDEARFTATFVEGASGNVAGEVAAKGGEFVGHPEGKFGAIAPKIVGTHDEDAVTETS